MAYLLKKRQYQSKIVKNKKQKLIDKVFNKMINDFHGDVYWRKLDCNRDNSFNENLIKAYSVVHNRSYDTIPIDYIKAGLKIHKGKTHRLKTFF